MNTFEAGPTHLTSSELPPVSRWKKVGAAVAFGLGVPLAAVTADSAITDNCAVEDTAFSFNLSPAQCDGYANFRKKITSIPDFSIVSEPIFNPDDLKLFSHDR